MLFSFSILFLIASFNVVNAVPMDTADGTEVYFMKNYPGYKLPTLLDLANKYKVDITDTQALLGYAIEERELMLARELIKCGADAKGRYPNGLSYLHRAIADQDMAAVKLLLAQALMRETCAGLDGTHSRQLLRTVSKKKP